jgi:glycosyltransferase involved in cell wall biosynthesis
VKNQSVVLDVLPLVSNVLQDVHWVIVGFPSDGAYFFDLQREISRRHLTTIIHVVPGLPPRSQEMADAYAASDVIVIPSIYEAFGMVLLEAWASGTPVVATRVGGPAELIRDGVDGLLVDAGDTSKMAERIVELLTEPPLVERIVEEATRRLDAFAWPAIAMRLASVYDRVLKPDA